VGLFSFPENLYTPKIVPIPRDGKMITITYDRVRSELSADDPRDLRHAYKLLDDNLSFHKEGYFFSPLYQSGMWDGKQHFFSLQTGKFYSGLISKAVTVLRKNGHDVEVIGYPEPKAVESIAQLVLPHPKLGQIELRDYQLEAVWKILRYSRGVIQVATNGGKTEIMAGTIKAGKFQKGVVYVPRKELLTQTAHRLSFALERNIGIVGDGTFQPDDITVAMYHTIAKRKKTPKLSKTIRFLKDAEFVFPDECHCLSDDRYFNSVEGTTGDVRVGFSGTPFREGNVQKHFVLGLTGPVLANLGNDTLIERGISANLNAVFLPVNLTRLASTCKYGLDWGVVEMADERNRLVALLAEAFVATGRQTVVLVRHTDHGKRIHRHYPGATLTHSQASNRVKTLKRLESGEKFACICTPIFDTGIDVPDIEALIYAGGGCNEISIKQSIGRTLRQNNTGNKTAWYVDFDDEFNSVCAKHSRGRQIIIESTKGFKMAEGFPSLPPDVYAYLQERM